MIENVQWLVKENYTPPARVMAPILSDAIPSQKLSHNCEDANRSYPQQSVLTILENVSALNSPDDQMLKRPRSIDAGLPWHEMTIQWGFFIVDLYFLGSP